MECPFLSPSCLRTLWSSILTRRRSWLLAIVLWDCWLCWADGSWGGSWVDGMWDPVSCAAQAMVDTRLTAFGAGIARRYQAWTKFSHLLWNENSKTEDAVLVLGKWYNPPSPPTAKAAIITTSLPFFMLSPLCVAFFRSFAQISKGGGAIEGGGGCSLFFIYYHELKHKRRIYRLNLGKKSL